MWLKKFKIALVQQSADDIIMLLDNIPEFSSLSELQEARNLVDSANELFKSLQQETKNSMVQMKKNIDFLNSTREEEQITNFDITS